jgi:TRAP-type C4-dicarboxylate transport system permease small subunit
MTLRRLLDMLYEAAGTLAALFMVGTLLMVLLGIASRVAGWFVPGTDAYAGYCMAATGFLALAHTFRRGEHIRVTLLLEHTGPVARRRLELWSIAAGTALAAALAFYSVKLAYQSWDYNDVSTGNDATPLWIPQLAMAGGSIVLAVALLDALLGEWRGRRARAEPAAPLHNE